MFYGYHITINRKTSDIDAAYKIFFIILELISDYQLSALLIILFSRKSVSSSGDALFLLYRSLDPECVFFQVLGREISLDKNRRAVRLGKAIRPFQRSEKSQTAPDCMIPPAKIADKKHIG